MKKKLAEALTLIYNKCLISKAWPRKWKVETVVPIPKTISPGSMDDIRPISMTTLWSKILETIVAQFTLQETGRNWKNDQFGGRKGTSADHVLISLWDKILEGIDSQGGKASVITAVDFSNSFSRCSFQQILLAYQKLGLSDWGLAMHAAFLSNREMRVKVGNILSNPHPVTGGAVQGSVLGVMDHNAIMEFIDEDNDFQQFYKYIDDLTLEETISKSIQTLVDNSTEPPTHFFKPDKTQLTLNRLSDKCDELGLKINENKTQLLTISSARNTNHAWLTLKDRSTLYSADKLKLLGFVFNKNPNVHMQINSLISKAASRSFVIRHLASQTANKAKLKKNYCAIVRSVLEYSSVTYGPMLAQYKKTGWKTYKKVP